MATITPLTADQLEPLVLGNPGVVALDFYQASCPPCRALEPRLERLATDYAHFPFVKTLADFDFHFQPPIDRLPSSSSGGLVILLVGSLRQALRP